MSLSLLLVACGGDDDGGDNGQEAGSNNAVVTPTATISVSSTMESLNIQPGAVMEEPGSESADKPTIEIVWTQVPASPGPVPTEPKRGSDGSMSNQALGTPTATPSGTTGSGDVAAAASPEAAASPVGSPEASPAASPNASPANGTPEAGQ